MFGRVEATRLSASSHCNAAWPSVRSEFSRNRNCSTFLIPFSNQLRGRWLRWSVGGKVVSSVYFPSSNPDECVTRMKHRVLPGFGGGIVHGPARMLLQHVVNVLDAGDVALPDAIDAFVEPSDGRPERDAVVTDF